MIKIIILLFFFYVGSSCKDYWKDVENMVPKSKHKNNRFNYERLTEWPDMCNAGMNQSPIVIRTEKAFPLAMPALEMVGFHNLIPRPIKVKNSGHSVELSFNNRSNAKIFGALLEGEYKVIATHFHWSRFNNKGSEHQINKVTFPMEMHIVSVNSKYPNVDIAKEHSDGLAVMAFFYHLREKGSQSLQPMLDELEFLSLTGSSLYLSQSFTLASLLPSDTEVFYTYRGSLTTPSCEEAVTWIIFPDPMPISFSQLNKFRSMSNEHSDKGNNFRPPQDLNRRKVFVRKIPTELQDDFKYDISYPPFWGLT